MPPGSAEPVYFLDHDGRLFLIQSKGQLALPTRSDVPFAFAEKRRVGLRGTTVVFGSPMDKHAHEDWVWKDELPFMQNVDALARTAANLSMTRVVAKGAITRPGEVLLVKPRVGYFKGHWSLPGGYLDYGESPEQCLVREVEEELGVPCEVVRLLHLDSRVVDSGVHFLSFLFQARLGSEELTLKGDEIEDARWFHLDRALREVGSALSREGLEALLREERSK